MDVSDRPRGLVTMTRTAYVLGLNAVLFLVLGSAPVLAQSSSSPTYSRDVAPILQQNCQVCHREGAIAPMALDTYEGVRRYSARIRDRVVSRQMPPWPMDKSVGIQEFKNDISLSEEEIQTIAEWVDAGAPMGDPAEMPVAVEWTAFEEAWRFEDHFDRPPDIVVTSPEYLVPANELDHWPNLTTDIPGLGNDDRSIQGV